MKFEHHVWSLALLRASGQVQQLVSREVRELASREIRGVRLAQVRIEVKAHIRNRRMGP